MRKNRECVWRVVAAGDAAGPQVVPERPLPKRREKVVAAPAVVRRILRGPKRRGNPRRHACRPRVAVQPLLELSLVDTDRGPLAAQLKGRNLPRLTLL
jgi:hypothetical protein